MTRDYKRFRIVLILLMFLTAVPLSAGQGQPFTNEDVLEMVEAGFAEATVLEAIQANEVDFDTSVDALLALKNAGVGENIILEMLGAAQHDPGLSGKSPEGVTLPRRSESMYWRTASTRCCRWSRSSGSRPGEALRLEA